VAPITSSDHIQVFLDNTSLWVQSPKARLRKLREDRVGREEILRAVGGDLSVMEVGNQLQKYPRVSGPYVSLPVTVQNR
jgi:hypothetical protein